MPCRLLAALAIALVLAGCYSGPRAGGTRGKPPAPSAEPVLEHVVAAGDTLSQIARAYNISLERIIAANRLRDRELHPGQRLLLPGATRPLPPVEPVAPPPPPAAWFIPRSQWAVDGIDLGNIDPMGRPWRITVHHTDELRLADGTRENGDPVKVLRFYDRAHKQGDGKNKPFACIGYHFLISADGRVWEGRPLQYQGAHAFGDNNKGNIGICLLGDFDRYAVPTVQRDRLIEVLDRLCRDHGIKPDSRTVRGHHDFAGENGFTDTSCPGAFLEPIVHAYAAGRLRSALSQRE